MPENKIGKIPDFTPGEQISAEEVKSEEGKPLENLPLEEKPIEETKPIGEQEAVKPEGEEVVKEDTGEAVKQVQGLETERQKLLDEIKSLRGERRELKQQEILKVQDQIDELKDVNPEDVKVIKRIARGTGFTTKEDVKQMFYEEVKQDVLNDFLDKYPEFKPENDSNDSNWNALQRELGWYKMPSNPRQIKDVLERARKAIMPTATSERSIPETQRKLKTASMGTGGVQRSSSHKALTEAQRNAYRNGGWSEEEINVIEKKL